MAFHNRTVKLDTLDARGLRRTCLVVFSALALGLLVPLLTGPRMNEATLLAPHARLTNPCRQCRMTPWGTVLKDDSDVPDVSDAIQHCWEHEPVAVDAWTQDFALSATARRGKAFAAANSGVFSAELTFKVSVFATNVQAYKRGVAPRRADWVKVRGLWQQPVNRTVRWRARADGSNAGGEPVRVSEPISIVTTSEVKYRKYFFMVEQESADTCSAED